MTRRYIIHWLLAVLVFLSALPFILWIFAPVIIAKYSPWLGPCVTALARMSNREDYSFRERFQSQVANLELYTQPGNQEEVRKVAFWMLGILGDKDSYGSFEQGAFDPDYSIKVHALSNVSGLTDDDRVIGLLSTFAKNEDEQIRGIIADGFGCHLNPITIEVLHQLCYDQRKSVKCRAIIALSNVSKQEDRALGVSIIEEVLSKDESIRSCAERALRKILN